MRTAITFTTDSEGIATGYFQTRYRDYLREVKNVGYKPHLSGFKTTAEAETAANAIVGLPLEQALSALKSPAQPDQDADNQADQTEDQQ